MNSFITIEFLLAVYTFDGFAFVWVSCEKEFYGDERIYICDGDAVCADCLKERLLEAYSIDDLADAFDIRKTTAGDYLEESEENPYDGD